MQRFTINYLLNSLNKRYGASYKLLFITEDGAYILYDTHRKQTIRNAYRRLKHLKQYLVII